MTSHSIPSSHRRIDTWESVELLKTAYRAAEKNVSEDAADRLDELYGYTSREWLIDLQTQALFDEAVLEMLMRRNLTYLLAKPHGHRAKDAEATMMLSEERELETV